MNFWEQLHKEAMAFRQEIINAYIEQVLEKMQKSSKPRIPAPNPWSCNDCSRRECRGSHKQSCKGYIKTNSTLLNSGYVFQS